MIKLLDDFTLEVFNQLDLMELSKRKTTQITTLEFKKYNNRFLCKVLDILTVDGYKTVYIQEEKEIKDFKHMSYKLTQKNLDNSDTVYIREVMTPLGAILLRLYLNEYELTDFEAVILARDRIPYESVYEFNIRIDNIQNLLSYMINLTDEYKIQLDNKLPFDVDNPIAYTERFKQENPHYI